MTPRQLLARLKAEGATATLKLRVEGTPPSTDTLAALRANREALVDYLAAQRVGGLDIAPVLVHSLLTWVDRYHALHVQTPDGLVLNAPPERATELLARSLWALVYDETGVRLVSKGNVPPEVRAEFAELDATSPFAQPRPAAERTAVLN